MAGAGVSVPTGPGGTAAGDLLRGLTPQVLGLLVCQHGQFDAREDAV
ncbi:hypothetical protein [Micromonospora carbonacea]|nr:hypothetical protein [Micromonospora carbonacea]